MLSIDLIPSRRVTQHCVNNLNLLITSQAVYVVQKIYLKCYSDSRKLWRDVTSVLVVRRDVTSVLVVGSCSWFCHQYSSYLKGYRFHSEMILASILKVPIWYMFYVCVKNAKWREKEEKFGSKRFKNMVNVRSRIAWLAIIFRRIFHIYGYTF